MPQCCSKGLVAMQADLRRVYAWPRAYLYSVWVAAVQRFLQSPTSVTFRGCATRLALPLQRVLRFLCNASCAPLFQILYCIDALEKQVVARWLRHVSTEELKAVTLPQSRYTPTKPLHSHKAVTLPQSRYTPTKPLHYHKAVTLPQSRYWECNGRGNSNSLRPRVPSLHEYQHMCIHVYIYIYICIYMNTCICVYIRI